MPKKSASKEPCKDGKRRRLVEVKNHMRCLTPLSQQKANAKKSGSKKSGSKKSGSKKVAVEYLDKNGKERYGHVEPPKGKKAVKVGDTFQKGALLYRKISESEFKKATGRGNKATPNKKATKSKSKTPSSAKKPRKPRSDKGKPRKPKSKTPSSAKKSKTPSSAKKPRKPRSDKGKPRKPKSKTSSGKKPRKSRFESDAAFAKRLLKDAKNQVRHGKLAAAKNALGMK
jgi:hypothetical protein